MEQNYKILHSKDCERDLDDIENYITFNLCSPTVAEKLIDKLYNATFSLSDSPKRYKIYDIEPWRSRELRYFYMDNYVIFYLVDDDKKEVSVLRIIYKARDLNYQLSNSEHYFVSDNNMLDENVKWIKEHSNNLSKE